MNFYELSLRSLVNEEQIRQFLAAHRGLNLPQIGTELEYLDRIGTATPLRLGLEVLFSETGFRTFAKWIEEAELSPNTFATLAAAAARCFGTEAVIGDVLTPSEEPDYYFLLFHPSGAMKRAIVSDNTGVFDVRLLDEDE